MSPLRSTCQPLPKLNSTPEFPSGEQASQPLPTDAPTENGPEWTFENISPTAVIVLYLEKSVYGQPVEGLRNLCGSSVEAWRFFIENMQLSM
jgi:hypothetical protein